MKYLPIFIILSACTIQEPKEKIIYLPIPIEKPIKPDYPKITSSDLQCLPDTTKKLLIKRDIIIKAYITALEQTIDATK